MAPKASYIRSCEKKNKMIFTVGLLPPPGRGISIQNDRGRPSLPLRLSSYTRLTQKHGQRCRRILWRRKQRLYFLKEKRNRR